MADLNAAHDYFADTKIAFTKEQAEEIADSLNVASLPVRVRLVEKPTDPHASVSPPAELQGRGIRQGRLRCGY